LIALIREPFGTPQYYEDTNGDWAHAIGAQIVAYESSGLAGLSGIVWSFTLAIVLAIGGFRAIRNWQHPSVFVVIAWGALTIVMIFVLTPLDWQRYFLPIVAPLSVIGGMAVSVPSHSTSDFDRHRDNA
jgi:4-amino-4-deoxy-L-arabinose transferase-like glycosyltransferase